jgi:diguanylate cyclase (GGDEF)-like protein
MKERKEGETRVGILKKEAITVVGSVLATLIATTLINQFSNIRALLSQRIQVSIAIALLLILIIAFVTGLLGILLVRRTKSLALERAEAREDQLRNELQNEIKEIKTNYEDRISRLKGSMEELKAEAAIDIVTGVYNRNQIPRLLGDRIGKANTNGKTFCVLLIDIDGFRRVNNNYDHEVGDKVLKRVAEILQPGRNDDDLIARYGGDEFLIISKLGTDVHGGYGFANRLRGEIEEETFYATRNEHVRLTISCGVTNFRPKDDVDSLLKRAATALHEAKQPRTSKEGTEEKNWVHVIEKEEDA